MRWTSEQLDNYTEQTTSPCSDDVLINTYNHCGSIIKTAASCKITENKAWLRLQKLHKVHNESFDAETERKIIEFYEKEFSTELCIQFCRDNDLRYTAVRQWATKTGVAKKVAESASEAKTESAQKRKWKQGWYNIGTRRIFMRSRWEVNYAFYLEILIKAGSVTSWDYEPETFWFEGIRRGTTSYKPDFKVTLKNGTIEYHEVKGFMDPKSITKLKRMKKYHPTVVIVLRDKEWFKTHRSLKNTVPGWI